MVSSSVAQRSSVDLPPPEGPMIDTTSPFSTVSDMPFKHLERAEGLSRIAAFQELS